MPSIFSGFPGFSAAKAITDRLRRWRTSPASVFRDLRRGESLPQASRPASRTHLTAAKSSGYRDSRHLRRHGGHDERHDDRLQPRRQGDRVLPFYENTTARTRFSPAQTRSSCRSSPRRSTLTATCWKTHSASTPRRSSCATRRTRAAKVFQGRAAVHRRPVQPAYDAYMITDEVYEHIVFAPYHRSIRGFSAGDRRPRDLLLLPFQDVFDHRLAPRLPHRAGKKRDRGGAKKVHDFLTVGRRRQERRRSSA